MYMISVTYFFQSVQQWVHPRVISFITDAQQNMHWLCWSSVSSFKAEIFVMSIGFGGVKANQFRERRHFSLQRHMSSIIYPATVFHTHGFHLTWTSLTNGNVHSCVSWHKYYSPFRPVPPEVTQSVSIAASPLSREHLQYHVRIHAHEHTWQQLNNFSQMSRDLCSKLLQCGECTFALWNKTFHY